MRDVRCVSDAKDDKCESNVSDQRRKVFGPIGFVQSGEFLVRKKEKLYCENLVMSLLRLNQINLEVDTKVLAREGKRKKRKRAFKEEFMSAQFGFHDEQISSLSIRT